MIPQTFPSFTDARGVSYARVFFLTSVTGLTRWVDYVPVKTVAYSTANEGTTNQAGHLTVAQVASSTSLTKWVDYLPVYEDAAATTPYTTDPNGYLPVCQILRLDFLTPLLDSRITFTRADATSCATYFGSDGLLKTAAANVARFDYDPVTLQPRGLLIEESRTNLLLQSRDMTQAAWSKTDVTPTRNQVGIDGTANSACLMTEGTLLTARAQQNGAAVTAGSTITSSFVVKRGNTDWVRVLAGETTLASYAQAWFNLATGAKGAVTAVGSATSISSSITNLGGGWYRCTVTCIPDGTYTVPAIWIQSASADNSQIRVSGATYIVDAAQLEVGAFATSIITTTASTVTRAADSASMTGTNFSSWFNQTQGTFVSEAAQIAPNNSAGIISRTDAGNADLIFGGQNIIRTRDAVPTVINSNTFTAATYGSVVKGAMSYDATGRSVTGQGLTPVTGTYDLSYATMVGLQIGKNAGASLVLNGWIRRLTYYPTRLQNATLQALTS